MRLAATAAMLLGAARLAHRPAPRLARPAVVGGWLAGAGAQRLSHAGPGPGLGWLALLWFNRQAQPSDDRNDAATLGAASAIGALIALGSAWTGALALPDASLALSRPWDSWGRLLLWFTWPAWPLALWTVWRWRRQWQQPHVALPLWAVLIVVLHSALDPERDRALLLALPALAALAAFALPTCGAAYGADRLVHAASSFYALVYGIWWP